MRWALPLLVSMLLAGCSPAVPLVAAEMATVTVFGRGVGDVAVSAITGRDCSIVRLDSGKTYCAPRDDVPVRQPFCTRTIGVVNCWADPFLVPQGQHDMAETPMPTEDQLRYRSSRWPKSLTF